MFINSVGSMRHALSEIAPKSVVEHETKAISTYFCSYTISLPNEGTLVVVFAVMNAVGRLGWGWVSDYFPNNRLVI
jgi:hypothetical protein